MHLERDSTAGPVFDDIILQECLKSWKKTILERCFTNNDYLCLAAKVGCASTNQKINFVLCSACTIFAD